MTVVSTEVSYPVGVRSLLFGEAARRRAIESAVVEKLEDGGYREVILPIVDFVDPYGGILDEQAMKLSYRFTDREGELVAIRSDFTPMVARVLAPAISPGSDPLRVFYRGDVIRCLPSRLGKNREFFQIGAELIGGGSAADDVEVIQLALAAVAACGARPAVTFSDSSLVDVIAAGSGLDEADAKTLRVAAARKSPELLANLRGRLTERDARLVAKLIDGTLALDDLANDARTAAIAERLSRVASEVGGAGSLLLDDVSEQASYYTGVRFRVFAGSAREPVASGGRYDALYGCFGTDVPAVGFTLNVDALEVSR